MSLVLCCVFFLGPGLHEAGETQERGGKIQYKLLSGERLGSLLNYSGQEKGSGDPQLKAGISRDSPPPGLAARDKAEGVFACLF